MVNKEWCDKCPYHKAFYVGTENVPAFHDVCYWALKAVNNVGESECKRFMLSKELLKKVVQVVNGEK